MQERRASPRIKIRFKVGVLLSSGEVHYVWTYDISLGGMQLLSEYSADSGDILRVFFSALDTETDTYVRVVARIRVIRAVYDGSERCFRIGVEFVDFEGNGRSLYNRYLDSRLYSRYGQRLGVG
jgi:c-di-GMP-binding flagellar brake protein YcgR